MLKHGLLFFQVPKHIRKGKDVTVEIGRKHIKASCKDVNGQTVVLVDGDLIWECHKDECVWSLVPGEHVHVRTLLNYKYYLIVLFIA